MHGPVGPKGDAPLGTSAVQGIAGCSARGAEGRSKIGTENPEIDTRALCDKLAGAFFFLSLLSLFSLLKMSSSFACLSSVIGREVFKAPVLVKGSEKQGN